MKPTAFTQLKKNEAKKLCNKVRVELKRDYVHHTIDKFKDDPKRIWRVIREFWPNNKGKHVAINKLQNVTGDKNIAERFNKHFSKVADTLLENIPLTADGPLPEEVFHPQSLNMPLII